MCECICICICMFIPPKYYNYKMYPFIMLLPPIFTAGEDPVPKQRTHR